MLYAPLGCCSKVRLYIGPEPTVGVGEVGLPHAVAWS